jgi:hypothetical protein
VEFRKQNFLHENEEPESRIIERTMRDLNFTEGLAVTAAGTSLSAETDSNEKRAAATGPRIVKMFAFLL